MPLRSSVESKEQRWKSRRARRKSKGEKGEKREAMAESDSCLERICVAAGSGTMLGCIVGAGVSAPI